MKKLLIVFFAALFAVSCNQKKDEAPKINDLLSDNLKGDVKQVTETPYQTDSLGKPGSMDSCCIQTMNYDSAGNIAKVVSKDSKGNIKNESLFKHYDNGLMKEINNTENGKMSAKISIQVDKAGKYTTAQEYDSSGKLKYFYKEIKQNDYNQLTSMKQFKADSTLNNTFETNYDKQIFTGQVNTDSSGKEVFKSSAKVDDKGNQTEFTSASTTTEPKTKKDSTTNKTVKYKYDSFDSNGNWTQRTEIDEKGKPTKIVKREITYYKK